jgi:ribonuclease D
MPHRELIRDRPQFLAVVDRLAELSAFAFDTEFIRERRYSPQLCLLQIAAAEVLVAVDPFTVGDLEPLVALIADPAKQTVVHAGQQDMEIFFAGSQRTPRGLFDTQIAAGLLGYGDSVGFSRLVAEVLGVQLAKVETFTDWSQRPLAEHQVQYALDDVRFLLALRDKLTAELESLGRASWLADELKCYEDPRFYRHDPSELYLRVRGAARLSRRSLAVLREMAAWREEEAQARDRPRGRILSDDFLLELARRAPKTPRELAAMRGLHPQLVKRCGTEILRRVQLAEASPSEGWPESLERNPRESRWAPVVDLLEVVVKSRAEEARISPSYLATRGMLYDLVCAHSEGSATSTPVLSGWRGEIVGKDLLGFLRGETAIGLEGREGRVVVRRS